MSLQSIVNKLDHAHKAGIWRQKALALSRFNSNTPQKNGSRWNMRYVLIINGLIENLMKTSIFLRFIHDNDDSTSARCIPYTVAVNVKSEAIIAIHHNNGQPMYGLAALHQSNDIHPQLFMLW